MDKWIEEGRESWQVNEDKRVEREKVRLGWMKDSAKKKKVYTSTNNNITNETLSPRLASLTAPMKPSPRLASLTAPMKPPPRLASLAAAPA